MNYTPDSWKVLKCTKDDKVVWYKVYAGWRGSFVNGDYWKLNSGITKVTKEDDAILFHGQSGSIYECYLRNENIDGEWLNNVKTDIIETAATVGRTVVEIDFVDFEKEFAQ